MQQFGAIAQICLLPKPSWQPHVMDRRFKGFPHNCKPGCMGLVIYWSRLDAEVAASRTSLLMSIAHFCRVDQVTKDSFKVELGLCPADMSGQVYAEKSICSDVPDRKRRRFIIAG